MNELCLRCSRIALCMTRCCSLPFTRIVFEPGRPRKQKRSPLLHFTLLVHLARMPASARPSKKTKLSREPSSSPPPEEIDSEEDEWEQERVAGPSSARSKQFEQDDDEEMYEGEDSDEEEDGVGQYMEDEGEVMQSDDEEVRSPFRGSRASFCRLTEWCCITGSARQTYALSSCTPRSPS